MGILAVNVGGFGAVDAVSERVLDVLAPASELDDLALLSRFAPVLALDSRERFRPIRIDGYVEGASLVDSAGRCHTEVGVEDLDDRWDHWSYLQFIERTDRTRSNGVTTPRPSRSSRLGRVGLLGRLLDALFQLSVWLRPTLPRNTAAAAQEKAERLGLHERTSCYGRVVRAGEWLVAHYAYFYAMNDWRSGYRGLNDHEADWEQAWVFIDPLSCDPVWLATTNHDHSGADMRRHWSDPELTFEGDRPVLFVAAGSHALLFQRGEFVTRLDVPGLRWILRAQVRFRDFLAHRKIMRRPTRGRRGVGPALGVPFVDAAHGDGAWLEDIEVVPFGEAEWVESFRGLWGRDTGDPLDGERGPGGPKFDRRGEVRASWADPAGFAGLHGSLPPSALAARVNLDKVQRVLQDLDTQIRNSGRLLPLASQTASAEDLRAESVHLTQLLRRRTELADLEQRIQDGRLRTVGIRDHLIHPAVPAPSAGRRDWVRAGWGAVTMPAILVLFALVVLSETLGFILVAVVFLAVAIPVDQAVRGNWRGALVLLGGEAAALALATLAVSRGARWSELVASVILLSAAIGLLFSNLAELRAPKAERESGLVRVDLGEH